MTAALQIDDLNVSYGGHEAPIAAVRAVSLHVAESECVGVVGESGSGKTQVFMASMGLLGREAMCSGRVRFRDTDMLTADQVALNRVRGSKLTMIFQDPMTSLTPHLKIGTQLCEVLVRHSKATWRDARSTVAEMLERVRISDPRRRMAQYPHQFSGGMRQRVMIAMSLLCRPALVIADEPTTALDVTVQAQIMDLLRGLRHEFGMALVLISHDLNVVSGVADRILVMYAGRIVESGLTAQIMHHPRHPYTAELLKCVPSMTGPRLARLPTLAGQPPRSDELIAGCSFAPRCPRVAARCRVERPVLAGDFDAAQAACHFPLSA